MELDQDTAPEEQLPMDVVLREIRQMLLADIQGESQSVSSAPSPVPVPTENTQSDYFLLTPGMRCDRPAVQNQTALSESVQQKTRQVLDKLSRLQESETGEKTVSAPSNSGLPAAELEAALTHWLNTKLPDVLEKIVAQELQKAINKKQSL